MVSITGVTLLGLVCLGLLSRAWRWRRLYLAARKVNVPVYLCPVHISDIWWVALLYIAIRPILLVIPQKWLELQHPAIQFSHVWRAGHKPFEQAGSDSFIIATPRGNMFFTCDPEVIRDLDVRQKESHVAAETLSAFEPYGPSVGSTEGEQWKKHRKIIMAGFTPALNAAVWRETSEQTASLMKLWSDRGGVISKVPIWTCRLALHVLSAVCFGKGVGWGVGDETEAPVPPGFTMRYEEALPALLERLTILNVVPRWLLARLPIGELRRTWVAYSDWTKYMKDLLRAASGIHNKMGSTRHKTVLESITQAAASGSAGDGGPMAEESVLGNMFFFFIAGHDSSGNTMAFALHLLALYPDVQRQVQNQLDDLLARRPRSQWTVESEYHTLQKGWLGAVINEVQRLYTVASFIPRKTVATMTVVDSDGLTHVIPEQTLCFLDFPAAFRNPRHWSQSNLSADGRASLHHSPALDFDPTRWLDADDSIRDLNSTTGKAPIFFPFGQGPRVCPGRLFARVEITAMITALLADHSLELVVTGDAQLRQDDPSASPAWEAARDKAFVMLVDDLVNNVSLSLPKELPLRLVRRRGSDSMGS